MTGVDLAILETLAAQGGKVCSVWSLIYDHAVCLNSSHVYKRLRYLEKQGVIKIIRHGQGRATIIKLKQPRKNHNA